MLEDLESLGLDLTQSYDTGHRNQPKLFMEDGTLLRTSRGCVFGMHIRLDTCASPRGDSVDRRRIRLRMNMQRGLSIRKRVLRVRTYVLRLRSTSQAECGNEAGDWLLGGSGS
eukprot:6185802-Pleurochrysis_carterae.AAC.2